jgi:hypothetical protein
MGVYTAYNEEWIDAKLQSKIDVVTEELLKSVEGIRSILLTGGFGRGEGSIRLLKERELKLLKDFDIVVIVDEIPPAPIQESLLETIYARLNLKNAEHEKFRFSQFVVDIKFLRTTDLAYPDIWFYDLKSAGKLLYGESISKYNSYSAEDIPLSSGFRILFEKVTGLLAHFSYDYLKGKSIDSDERDSLVYECLKAYIEMGTVLCILTKNYRPSYLERSYIIRKIFDHELSDLAKIIPEFPSLVERATSFKLRPDSIAVNQDPLEMWFLTRDHLGVIIRFYLERILDVRINDWTDLPSLKYKLAKTYYVAMLQSWMRQKLGHGPAGLIKLLNLLYNTLLNLEYIYQIRKNEQKLYLKPLQVPVSPSLKFFLAAPLALFSLNKGASVKQEYLDSFFNELKYCIPIDVIGPNENKWEIAKDHYLKAYRLYNGFHMVK